MPAHRLAWQADGNPTGKEKGRQAARGPLAGSCAAWRILPLSISGLLLIAAVLAAVAVWASPGLRRWFAGKPLDGKARTNATWRLGSTRVLDVTGHTRCWHHWPQRRVAGLRTGTTLGTLAITAGLIAAPPVTITVLAVTTAAGTGLAGRRLYRLLAQAEDDRAWMRPVALLIHYRFYVRPCRDTLTHLLGVPPRRLTVPPDRRQVTIGLPHSFTGSDKERQAITRAVAAKLAIEAPEANWSQLRGPKPRVTFAKSAPPPARVLFGQIVPEIRQAKSHEIILGKARPGAGGKHRLIQISIDVETPHVGISMGTGDGKSTFARLIACQLLFHGAICVFLDPKLISHMWARGLPNVVYAGTEEEIDTVLLALQEEVRNRNKVVLAGADVRGEVHADVGPRIAVFGEELNTTQNRLKAWWRSVRQKGDPARPPSSEALDEIIFTGRQVRVNVFMIGQRLSAKASGSGDARDTLGDLIFCDPSESTWRMTVGADTPRPPAAGHQGRYQLVTRKEICEFQAGFIEPEDARAFAMAGTVGLPRHDMPCVGGPAPRGAAGYADPRAGAVSCDIDTMRAIEGPDLGQVPLRPGGPPPDVPALQAGAVTLEQALAAELHPSKSLVGARKASTRDPDHPAPVGRRGSAHLYDVAELHAYRQQKEKVSR